MVGVIRIGSIILTSLRALAMIRSYSCWNRLSNTTCRVCISVLWTSSLAHLSNGHGPDRFNVLWAWPGATPQEVSFTCNHEPSCPGAFSDPETVLFPLPNRHAGLANRPRWRSAEVRGRQ